MGGPRSRFTLDGSDALEVQLEQMCALVCAGVQRTVPPAWLEGLLLGGGYGRGEGGVLQTPAGERPYNDLEFYVFVRGNPHLAEFRFGDKLRALGHRLTLEFAIEIEFKIITSGKLRRASPSMFYYDLALGHRWLLGTENLLNGCDHHKDAGRLPLSEAARLLMNRCSGLLFARQRLARPGLDDSDRDFTARNQAKLQLGLGDAWLTAHQQYHWSCVTRHARLRQFQFKNDLAWAAPIVQHHAAGLTFKLHPHQSIETQEQLSLRNVELSAIAEKLWVWLESKRLGVAFRSAREYALSGIDKCPETHRFKNRLVNLRTFGVQAALGATGSRYPRERLFNSFPLLLFDRAGIGRGETLGPVQTALRTRASAFSELVERYSQLWTRFN